MTKVILCNICGHSGFLNAIIYCSECPDTAVHQYCLGIPPGSINDTFSWVCEYCSTQLEYSLRTPWKIDGEPTLKKCTGHDRSLKIETDCEIIDGPYQSEPLCILPPLSHCWSSKQEVVSNQCQIFEETARAASFSGHSLNVREEEEESVSSFMEQPEEILDGSVLVVSPSGVITIDEGRSFYDYSHSRGFETSILNSPDEIILDNLDKKLDPCRMKPNLSCTNKTDETVNKYEGIVHDYGTEEPMELSESGLPTDDKIDECHPNDFGGIRDVEGCTGTEVQDESEVISEHCVGSSMQRCNKGRALKSSHWLKQDPSRDDEGGSLDKSPGSSPLRSKRERPLESSNGLEEDPSSDVDTGNKDKSHGRSLQRGRSKRSKWFGCSEAFGNQTRNTCTNPVDDLRIEIPFETALSVEAEKESISKQIVDLFQGAGWTVKWMQSRHSKNRKCKTRVFVNPNGRIFWSAAKAYKALQQEVLEGTVSSSPTQVENYFSIKVSLETALVVWADRDSTRQQIEEMLLGAGWNIEYRRSKRIYMSPQGKAYWSFIEAHSVLKQEVIEGKGEVKASIAYLSSIKTLILNMLVETGWTVQNRRPRGGYKQTVYVSPEGKNFTSVHQAYYAFQRGVSKQ